MSTTEIVTCFDQAYPPIAATLAAQVEAAMDEIEAASGVRFLHRGTCAYAELTELVATMSRRS